MASVASPLLRRFWLHMKHQKDPFELPVKLDDLITMVKRARYELPEGVVLEVEGSPEEVASYIAMTKPSLVDNHDELAALVSQDSAPPSPPERLTPVRLRKNKIKTYGQLIDEAFIEKSVEYKNPRSAKDFRQKAEAFSSFIGDKPINEISAHDFSKFKQLLIKDGAAAQTINKYVQGVGVVFAHASRLQLYSGNLPTANQRAKVDKSTTRSPFLPTDIKTMFSVERMREVKDPSEFWFPLIGIHTGIRRSTLYA